MTTDLHKLRIEKHHKASRMERSSWPWVLLILVLFVAGAGFLQFRKSATAVPVETIRVRPIESASTPANDLMTLSATGYIMAAHKIELASKVVGRVAWIGVEMGDKVAKDQILVRLEDDEYKARVAQQQGQLDNAKARLAELEAGARPQEIGQIQAQLDRAIIEMENAKRNFQRLVDIKSARTISQNELDDAESLMKARQAQVEYMRQQLDLMKAGTRKEQIAAQRATIAQLEGSFALSTNDLQNTIIRAPMPATILERNVEVGEFVTTGFVGDRGAKGYVVSIADLNDLLVDLDISQNDFAKVAADQPCSVTTDAYPDRKYPGKVERISPVANRQKATVEVRVQILNPDGLLKPDMNATVSFFSSQSPNGSATTVPDHPLLRIPASAIRSGTVFIIENGKTLQRPITTGRTAANGDIEIRSGLSGGEDLVLHPPDSLKNNDPVTLKSPTAQ